jgi:hypothetical protein
MQIEVNYIYVIGTKYPNVKATCYGDPNVYSNLVWEMGDPIPTQAQLDLDIFSIQKSDMIVAVDTLADEVYTVAVSSPAKLLEYQEAERQAIAYKADNQVVGSYITVWANAKSWTIDQAADDIILTANRFRSAMIYIRQERLAAKESIRAETSSFANVQATMNIYTAKMMYLRSQLAASM